VYPRISYFVRCSNADPSVARQPSNTNYLLDKKMFGPSFTSTENPVLYNLWWAVCRNERLKYVTAKAETDGRTTIPPENAQSQTLQSAQASGSNGTKPAAPSSDKFKNDVVYAYQQYLTLKICEIKSNGAIQLDALREAMKRFDQGLRAKGYDPNALFAQAKDAPLSQSLKIQMLSFSLLPSAEGAEKVKILSVCQRVTEGMTNLINRDAGSPTDDNNEIDKIGKKDF
jgi:hypothetical protein